jgi:molybdopterin converting factor small subunit
VKSLGGYVDLRRVIRQDDAGEIMAITIQIPSSLRAEVDGARELRLTAASVRAALLHLQQNYPPLYRSVCDETGAVRRHVNLFVNDSFLSKRDGLDTPLASGDILTIMPAVSGG